MWLLLTSLHGQKQNFNSRKVQQELCQSDDWVKALAVLGPKCNIVCVVKKFWNHDSHRSYTHNQQIKFKFHSSFSKSRDSIESQPLIITLHMITSFAMVLKIIISHYISAINLQIYHHHWDSIKRGKTVKKIWKKYSTSTWF